MTGLSREVLLLCNVIEVALTLLAQREVRALKCALSLRARALTCKGLSTS